MRKIELDIDVLDKWVKEQWHLFSSQGYRKKTLRLWLNPAGTYRVVHGEKVLYEGKEKKLAIAAWNDA